MWRRHWQVAEPMIPSPAGNYRKMQCEQCRTSFWEIRSTGGRRILCRQCSRGSSATASAASTTPRPSATVPAADTERLSVTAMTSGAESAPTRRPRIQAQRIQVFQNGAARASAQLAPTSFEMIDALHERFQDLQFRELTPEDYELLQLLDDARNQQAAQNRRGSGALGLAGSGPPSAEASASGWRNAGSGHQMPPGGSLTRREFGFLRAPVSCGWMGADCAICLDALVEVESVCALPRCGHVFHRVCIEDWLTRGKASCPLDTLEVEI